MAYGFNRSITIDHTKVPNTDQTNFPVGIIGIYSYLATVANGGKIQNTVSFNGQTVPADLKFTSDSGGTTLLKWEVAAYNATTGEIEVWVQIPTLSHTTDTVIYAFYGDSGVTTYQGGAVGDAWISAFKGVYHLSGSLSLKDATSNAADLTNSGTSSAAGQINTGANGFPSNNVLTTANIALPTTFTVSYWAKITANANYQIPLGEGLSLELWAVDAGSGFPVLVYSGNNVAGTAAITDGAWHLVTGLWDGSLLKIYLDGVFSASAGSSTTALSTTFALGQRKGSTSYPLNGTLDEVRFAIGVLAADWIKTDFNNQNSPSTFYAVGAESGGGFTAIQRRTGGNIGTRIGARRNS